MTGPKIAEDPGLLVNRKAAARQALTGGVVVVGTDFRSSRRERIYDADRVWSGEHTIQDYTEV